MNTPGFIFQMSQWQTGVVFAFLILMVTLQILFNRKVEKTAWRVLFGAIQGIVIGISIMLMVMFTDGRVYSGDLKPDDPESIAGKVIWIEESKSWLQLIPGIFMSAMLFFVPLMIFTTLFRTLIDVKAGATKEFAKGFIALIFNVLFGLALAYAFVPLVKYITFSADTSGVAESEQLPTIPTIIGSWIPNSLSIFASTGALVAVIVAAMFMAGIVRAMSKRPKQAKYAKSFTRGNETLNEVIKNSIMKIVVLLPFVVASVFAELFIVDPGENFKGLGVFVGIIIGSSLIMTILNTLSQLWLKPKKLSNKEYLTALREPMTVSFTTTSSVVTLPHTINALEESGVNKVRASLIPSMASSMGMVTSSFYSIIIIYSTAHIQGVEMDAGLTTIAIVLAIITTMGIPGVPGGSIAKNIALLAAVGLPSHFFMATLPFDYFTDMFKTQANVSGALLATQAVNKFSKEK